jgi:hypothetical protein
MGSETVVSFSGTGGAQWTATIEIKLTINNSVPGRNLIAGHFYLSLVFKSTIGLAKLVGNQMSAFI